MVGLFLALLGEYLSPTNSDQYIDCCVETVLKMLMLRCKAGRSQLHHLLGRMEDWNDQQSNNFKVETVSTFNWLKVETVSTFKHFLFGFWVYFWYVFTFFIYFPHVCPLYKEDIKEKNYLLMNKEYENNFHIRRQSTMKWSQLILNTFIILLIS